jgi:hypothetical protein
MFSIKTKILPRWIGEGYKNLNKLFIQIEPGK